MEGKRAWATPAPPCGKPGCSPAQSAAVTLIPGVVFSGSVDGHLRGYDVQTGKIVWDVDTAREYPTVTGIKASGGSMDGPGAVVNSGYGGPGVAPLFTRAAPL